MNRAYYPLLLCLLVVGCDGAEDPQLAADRRTAVQGAAVALSKISYELEASKPKSEAHIRSLVTNISSEDRDTIIKWLKSISADIQDKDFIDKVSFSIMENQDELLPLLPDLPDSGSGGSGPCTGQAISAAALYAAAVATCATGAVPTCGLAISLFTGAYITYTECQCANPRVYPDAVC